MKILQNNFIINHRNNNWLSATIIFYKTKATKPAATIITAVFVIFFQVIVSVNTAKTSNHIQTDTGIIRASETWAKTLYGISKNLLIAQQSPKIPTEKPWQPPYSSTKITLKASSTLSPSHMSSTTTETVTQPRASSAEISALSLAKGDCKSLTTAWGDVDPNIFFICDKQTKQPLQLRCPQGKGFFLCLGLTACIPSEQWHACISSGHHEQVPLCDSEHMQQLLECQNPNKFYVCLKDTIKPTILKCEARKGFVHAVVTTSGVGGGGSDSSDGAVVASITSEIVGCANWEKWRNYMHCNGYY